MLSATVSGLHSGAIDSYFFSVLLPEYKTVENDGRG
jgi:hypothetical protein